MIEIGISPVAFTIGPLEVRWYGIMVALAVLTVILWMMREIRRGASLSYDTIITASLVGVPSGVVISRLLHVIDRWDYSPTFIIAAIATVAVTIICTLFLRGNRNQLSRA